MVDYSTRDLEVYRTVSDLRTQYMCEYRLYLKKHLGDRSTKAAKQGSQLHAEITLTPVTSSWANLLVLFFILLLTAISAIFWILG